jgi:hypothetical protein
MLIGLAATILGILIFLFLFWKRLKEDYAGEIIFKSATYILVGISTGWVLDSILWKKEKKKFPRKILLLLGLSFSILRFRLKFYETLEALVISSFPLMALFFLIDSGLNSSLSSFLAFTSILILLFLAYYLDMHYKSYTWYKSGKIGFAGLAVSVIFFLMRTAIAMMKVPVLSFVGRWEAVISGVAALVFFLLLFNLGRMNK